MGNSNGYYKYKSFKPPVAEGPNATWINCNDFTDRNKQSYYHGDDDCYNEWKDVSTVAVTAEQRSHRCCLFIGLKKPNNSLSAIGQIARMYTLHGWPFDMNTSVRRCAADYKAQITDWGDHYNHETHTYTDDAENEWLIYCNLANKLSAMAVASTSAIIVSILY